jgi:hypothetical protein
MPKKKAKEGKPEVHKDLDGLDMSVNQFGEIKTTLDFDKINEFLNKNVDDKKLREKNEKEEKKKS